MPSVGATDLITLLLDNRPSPDVTRRAEQLIIEAMVMGGMVDVLSGGGAEEGEAAENSDPLSSLFGAQQATPTAMGHQQQRLRTNGFVGRLSLSVVNSHKYLAEGARDGGGDDAAGREEGTQQRAYDPDDFESLGGGEDDRPLPTAAHAFADVDSSGLSSSYFLTHAIALPSSPTTSTTSPSPLANSRPSPSPVAFSRGSSSPLRGDGGAGSSPLATGGGGGSSMGRGGLLPPMISSPTAVQQAEVGRRSGYAPPLPSFTVVPTVVAQGSGGGSGSVRSIGMGGGGGSAIAPSPVNRRPLPPLSHSQRQQQQQGPSSASASIVTSYGVSRPALSATPTATHIATPADLSSPASAALPPVEGLAYLNARHPTLGATALHIACEKGHFDVIDLLVLSGADTNLIDGGDAQWMGHRQHSSMASFLGDEEDLDVHDEDEEKRGSSTPSVKSKTSVGGGGGGGGGYTALQKLLRDGRHSQMKVAAAATTIITRSVAFGLAVAEPLTSPNDGAADPSPSSPSVPDAPPAAPAVKAGPIRGFIPQETSSQRKEREKRERLEAERLAKEREVAERDAPLRAKAAALARRMAFRQAGFDPNVRATIGMRPTALHIACELGHFAVIPLLLSAGANPCLQDDRGVTPLAILLENNLPFPEIASLAQLIISGGGGAAAGAGGFERTDSVVSSRSDATARGACGGSNRRFVFDPNLRDHKGRTVLHIAAQHKHFVVIALLMSVGADPNLQDTSERGCGNTALHWLLSTPIITTRRVAYPVALTRAAEALMRTRYSGGVGGGGRGVGGDGGGGVGGHGRSLAVCVPPTPPFQANVPNADGRTALHFACDYGHVDVALLLLDVGADPSCPDGQGQTPLHVACPNSFSLVRRLLEDGADVNALDAEQRTPIDVLQERYYKINAVVGEVAKGGGGNSPQHGRRRVTAASSVNTASPTFPLPLAFIPPDFGRPEEMDWLMDLFDKAFDALRAEGGHKSPQRQSRRSGAAPAAGSPTSRASPSSPW